MLQPPQGCLQCLAAGCIAGLLLTQGVPPPRRQHVLSGLSCRCLTPLFSLPQTLIDEGLLWPGEDVLSVDYKQQQTLASLTAEGKIAAHSESRSA